MTNDKGQRADQAARKKSKPADLILADRSAGLALEASAIRLVFADTPDEPVTGLF